MEDNMHEALKPISWLAGRWSTKQGYGKYPTMKDFNYHDTLEFICIEGILVINTTWRQPMFNVTTTSVHPDKQVPMHQERGFLRIKPGTNHIALITSHNFGVTTIEEGNVDVEKNEITLKSTSIARISFAKPPAVTKTMKVIKLLTMDTIEVISFMETEDTPLTEHLRAVYKKEV